MSPSPATPGRPHPSTSSSSSSVTSYGQVIEYIQGRLYLAFYTHPPTASTPFPYNLTPRTPHKRSKSQPAPGPTRPPLPPIYFSIDDSLLYNAFHHDFGPLHIGHLYRFAVELHDILGDPDNEDRHIVFWSKADSRSRANAACVLACYMVLIQYWPPHLALAPIAQADPPLMPFRDAGYSQADYMINVQDVVYGVWRAKEEGLCGLRDFSLEECEPPKLTYDWPITDSSSRYEKYERVDMGDFNWLTPSFLAFASPKHEPTQAIPQSSPLYSMLPTSLASLRQSTLPQPFKNVLSHFTSRNIGLVVRLNSQLYSSTYFTVLGIDHMDMIFEDGTCPPLPLVREFIRIAHKTITVKHRGVAVHCKAGLGRTGCLIGAYLIYRHGFTANEVIAFMRFMRPGMVVGPQQHWLHLNQGAFREWWFEDTMKGKLAAQPATPTKTPSMSKLRYVSNGQASTPPNRNQGRAVLGEVNNNESSAMSNQDENLPAPTPGQPRKTSRIQDRHHPYSRNASGNFGIEDQQNERPITTEVVSMHRSSRGGDESEEEWQLRMLTTTRTPSQSPNVREKRAVSYTATTTTASILQHTKHTTERETGNYTDVPSSRPKTPAAIKSGSGSGTLGVGKIRSSPRRTGDKMPGAREGNGGGVRKTSGRVGSVGTSGSMARRA